MYSMCEVAGVCRGSAHGTRTWNHCKSTGNVRQSSTVICFHIIKISRIVQRIHWFLPLLQLRSEPLKCLVIFSQFFALRPDSLVVLALSSFLRFRTHFGSEYLGEPFPSEIILLVDELVLVEIRQIRVVRPVTPIFEHKFVAENH